MAGISLAHSDPRPCSGEKTMRRCRYNDVIVIDVDSESYEEVIIIDVPESSPLKKTEGSSMLRKDKVPLSNVINIDDDDDEIPDNSHFVGVDNSRFAAGTSSIRRSIRIAQKDSAVEDCQFGQDKAATPVRLSKCKRTYSGNFFRKNRYGLDTDSDLDSSDNDDVPDCEVVEDTSGKVQEEWEKAVSRRRKDIISNVHSDSGTSDCVGMDYRPKPKSNDGTGQHKEASVVDEIDAQDFYRTDIAIHDQQNDKLAGGRSNFQASKIDGRKKNPSTSNFASTKKFDQPIPIVEDEKPSEAGPSPPKPDLPFEEDSSSIGDFGPIESEATTQKSKSSFEHEINQGRSFPKDNHVNVKDTVTRIVEDKEMDNVIPDRPTDLSSTPSCDVIDVSGKSLFPKKVTCSVQGKEGNHKETKLQEDDSMSDIQPQENKDDLPSQNCDTQETCIISEREKQKETDEYKRADEEEWASRQKALQIQSEEARRQRQLRKRRRTESLRLLDMERRQKERIEEVRNTQKKDEENMNLKETIRGEVRNELKKLEAMCKNMASLLHLLGIQVGSWPNPSPQETQVAYKRAMLTFHPDRAPQFDIRKQVEAEEKFKLVNRIKEKLNFQGK